MGGSERSLGQNNHSSLYKAGLQCSHWIEELPLKADIYFLGEIDPIDLCDVKAKYYFNSRFYENKQNGDNLFAFYVDLNNVKSHNKKKYKTEYFFIFTNKEQSVNITSHVKMPLSQLQKKNKIIFEYRNKEYISKLLNEDSKKSYKDFDSYNDAFTAGYISGDIFAEACEYFAKVSHLPKNVLSALHHKSYELGHSSGQSEIWWYFEDLSHLVLSAYEAGKSSNE